MGMKLVSQRVLRRFGYKQVLVVNTVMIGATIALFATVDIDETIPKEQYEAVAKVIGFIMGAGQRRQAKTAGTRARAL